MNSPRTILITGASSGLGQALALAYAKQNTPSILLLMGRNAASLKALQQECDSYDNITVKIAAIDVRDKQAMHTQLEAWDDAHNIDLAIANAGVSAGTVGGEAYTDSLHHVMETNINGVMHTIAPLLPHMVARQSGHIAIISSLAGFLPLAGAPAYSASKASVRYLGQALSMTHQADNITISTICPGYITTPLTNVNQFYMPFLMPAEKAAQRILRGIEKKKERILFPRRFYALICLLGLLPWKLQRLLLSRLPRK